MGNHMRFVVTSFAIALCVCVWPTMKPESPFFQKFYLVLLGVLLLLLTREVV